MRPGSLRRPLFYGWWIVGAGALVQMLIGGLIMQSFGAYGAILRDEFGWSKTLIASAFSMTRVESGILGPIQGWMITRFGPRFMMRFGVTIAALGLLAFSQINSPVHFFLAYLLVAIGASLGGFMTLTVAIVNWFERRRATALGIMSAGMAVGGLLTPIVILSLENVGWRETAAGSAVIIFVAGQVLATLIRRRPEDHGLTVDGVVEVPRPDPEPGAEEQPSTPLRPNRGSNAPSRDFTAREAMRTRAFWFISFGHASALLVVSAVMVHLVLHVNEQLGYSLGEAGIAIAIMTAFQIVGMLGGGMLGDRFPKRAIVVACMAGHCIALLLLAYATTYWMVVLFAMLHGLAWGGRGPLMQAIRADYFGRTNFATIMGFSSMIIMLGMTFGPIFAGVLADTTGDYAIGFTILAILAGLGSVFFILAKRPDPPERAEASERTRSPGAIAAPAGAGD